MAKETNKSIQEALKEGKTEGVVAEFPADKVISMEDAMKMINADGVKKSYQKQTAKQRKAEEAERLKMAQPVSKGEFIQQMQGFAENIDMGLQQYHENHLAPTQQAVEQLHNSFRAVNNLAEVIVEALIRKGVIDVEFLTSVQEEMIQTALAKQEEANTEETETTEQTTTEEEENNVPNNSVSDDEDSRKIQR